MTQQEKNEVTSFLNHVFSRINTAKEHLREHNYGLALKVLAEAYPELKIKVDD